MKANLERMFRGGISAAFYRFDVSRDRRGDTGLTLKEVLSWATTEPEAFKNFKLLTLTFHSIIELLMLVEDLLLCRLHFPIQRKYELIRL